MSRQITLDELREEMIDQIGFHSGSDAMDIIERHLAAGDRIKYTPQKPHAPSRRTHYTVGEPDPTPASAKQFCMARYLSADGGPHCSWEWGHAGEHVAGDSRVVLAAWWDDDPLAAAPPVEIADERDVDPPPSETRIRVPSAIGDTKFEMQRIEFLMDQGEANPALFSLIKVVSALVEKSGE